MRWGRGGGGRREYGGGRGREGGEGRRENAEGGGREVGAEKREGRLRGEGTEWREVKGRDREVRSREEKGIG